MRARLVASLFVIALSLSPLSAAEPLKVDVLLKGGLIYDGTGAEPVLGDVAIAGDRIVAIGKVDVAHARRTIDCEGLVICPGFIDLHSHSDRGITTPEARANVNFLTQGCTTVLTGNCGSGPTDVGAYLAKVDEFGAGTNVLHLLPHGALRGKVIGQEKRPPTEEELSEMKQIAEQAMLDGAWGMSTGLIYIPSSLAETDELVELASVVARHGGIYASHIRGEGSELLDAVGEALEIGRRSGAAVHVSHFKSSGLENWGGIKAAAALIEKARQEGQAATADQYPYTASSTSLEATTLPQWSREGGRDALRKRLRDKEQRDRIAEYIGRRLKNSQRLQIAAYSPRPDWIGRSIDEVAAAEGIDPVELIIQMELAGAARIVNFSMSEEDVRYAMQLPWVATASDGSAMAVSFDQPHPRNFGTFSRKLSRYALAEEVISLEAAIRSASGLPADILGLADRGYLKPGLAADVVVFDPKTLEDRATFDNPCQFSRGVQYVLVNGDLAIFDGTPTGALAGKAVRKKSPGSE